VASKEEAEERRFLRVAAMEVLLEVVFSMQYVPGLYSYNEEQM
jgi:hypothetical protein